MSDQLIHCKVTQISTNKNFYLSMIYGHNHDRQREYLWNDLMDIGHAMDEAWCLMGDFNALRSKEDIIGGNEVQDHELSELATLLEVCELHELKSTGAYFSWTNKTIWSRIDHVFLNDLWDDSFDYTHSSYLTNGLSDHTPILLQFPSSPKPPSVFQYRDMWSQHKEFKDLITNHIGHPGIINNSPMHYLCNLLKHLRKPLKRLHRENFSDLWEQQLKARQALELMQSECQSHPGDLSRANREKEARERYVSILSSSIDLIK